MKFDIFGIKKLKRDIIGLQTDLEDLRDKFVKAEEQIENLTENVKVLERINMYGRGDEPEVVIEDIYRNTFLMDVVMRLYIDGEEFTIHNVDGLLPTCFNPILKKSITVDGDIATVIVQQDEDAEDIYHIEYDKGTYVHQVRRIEAEPEQESDTVNIHADAIAAFKKLEEAFKRFN